MAFCKNRVGNRKVFYSGIAQIVLVSVLFLGT